MRKIIHSGYFAFDQTKMVEVAMLQAQYKDTQHVDV